MAGLTIGDPASFIGDGYVGDPPDFVGFPKTEGFIAGDDAVGSPYTIAMPAGITAGEKLIVEFYCQGGGGTITLPSGWSQVAAAFASPGGSDMTLLIYELDVAATGSETSHTLDVQFGGLATWFVRRISGADTSTLSEASTVATGATSSAPDSGSLTPSWGSAKTLWRSIFGTNDTAVRPTSYPLPNANDVSVGSRLTASCETREEVSSKDPAAFALSATANWIAFTIAIRPAAAVVEASIAVQMTATASDHAYGDEVDETCLLYEGTTCSPLEDTVADTTIAHAVFDDPVWVIDEDEWTPDWAQAPPKDVADETGETRGQVSNNDWIDEDEPVTDGTFSFPPDFEENAPLARLLGEVFDDDEPIVEFVTATPTAFPGDETGETTGLRSNNDHVDEDEPVTDGWSSWPIEDEPVAAVDDVGPQELGQVYDDEEPVSEGWFGEPLEEAPNDDILGRLLGEVFDDDEPVADGWFWSPLESAPGANDDINAVSFPADDDLEDEFPQAYADGLTGSPLEDTPPVVVQPGGKHYGKTTRKKKRVIPAYEDRTAPLLDPAPRGEAGAAAGDAGRLPPSPRRSRSPATLIARALLEPQTDAIKPVARETRIDLSPLFQAIGEEAAKELERRKLLEEADRLYDEGLRLIQEQWLQAQLAEAEKLAEAFHVKRRQREIEEERVLLMAALEALFDR